MEAPAAEGQGAPHQPSQPNEASTQGTNGIWNMCCAARTIPTWTGRMRRWYVTCR